MSGENNRALSRTLHSQENRDRTADFDSPWKEAIGAYFQPFLALFFPAVHDLIDWARPYEFPARMFQYYYRIYDRYGDVEILSLAVVTNQTLDPDSPLDRYQRERNGYGLRFRFRVQALRDWPEAALVGLAATHPFAVVALAQLAAHRRSKPMKRKVRKWEIMGAAVPLRLWSRVSGCWGTRCGRSGTRRGTGSGCGTSGGGTWWTTAGSGWWN